jgi:hypothetical protein
MLRRMIVPAGFAAVLGLWASAALADGERRRTVQDENRVESFDRTVEPPRREAARAPRRARRTGGYSHHLFIAGMSGHGLPGVVSVATVTYRTHVYYTPAYPSLSYGYPPHAHLYDLTPGPIYNKPCFC